MTSLSTNFSSTSKHIISFENYVVPRAEKTALLKRDHSPRELSVYLTAYGGQALPPNHAFRAFSYHIVRSINCRKTTNTNFNENIIERFKVNTHVVVLRNSLIEYKLIAPYYLSTVICSDA
jgi:hypothetical protein